ncbi:MAG: hypothetical protein IPK60_10680 [Sandaracinaceae bacterium]|jgi:outer membrane protein assembly factor BamB|nr:hypothetical protein [Sandaracinaceae bacterium]
MKPRHLLLLSASVATVSAVLLSLPASAVSTRNFTMDDVASFSSGELNHASVFSDATVRPGVEFARIAMPDIPVAYSIARGSDGAVFIGTGNDGKIFRLRGETLSVFAETHQLLVSALAWGEGGTLYAGTLPEGRIYAINAQGTMRELVRLPETDHIWALSFDTRRHTLFAGTGPQGKVFAIDANGHADVYYDAEAQHIMSLALDAAGNLYAGTSDQALLVRVRGPGRAEVVHDFPGNEVTALSFRNGTLAVAANEFSEAPSAGSATATTGATAPTATRAAASPRPRAGKGRLFRLNRDGHIEQIFSSDDGHFTSVELADDGTAYVGSGKDGRIYRVMPDRTSAMWIDVDERQVLAIALTGRDPVFVTGDAGAVYRIVQGDPAVSEWTSKVLDAEWTARFGELVWRGDGAIQFQTRSGNTERVDTSWSEWSAAMTTPGPIRSVAARYLQVRARFPRASASVLRSVTVYYLPQNQRASVRDVAVTRRSPTKRSTDSVPDTAQDDLPTPSATYRLTWKLDNPDGDRLRFRLQFRNESQDVWRAMHRESEIVSRLEYAWDTSAVPDGYYRVRVNVSDEPSNPAPYALTSNADSGPILVDNHAPRIEGLTLANGHLQGRAIDAVGPVSRLEYAIDGGEWRAFFPIDDLLDTANEAFDVTLTDVPSGAHIVAVRAVDAGGNVGSAEVATAPIAAQRPR